MRNVTLKTQDNHRIEAIHYEQGFKKMITLEKLGHAETMFDQQPDQFMKSCLDWFADTL